MTSRTGLGRRERRLRSALRRERAGCWTLFVLVGLVAVGFWPARLGGATSLVAVHGHSMEPTYHPGDLLVVRKVDEVRVGDVAVYRIADGVAAGRHVVHRVVEVGSDGRLTLRGDAKDAADDVRPGLADVTGVPVANLGTAPLRAVALMPWLAAAVIAVTVSWLLWPVVPPDERRHRLPGTIPAATVLESLAAQADGRQTTGRAQSASATAE